MRLRRGTLLWTIPPINQHLPQEKQHQLSWIMSEFLAITAAAAARIIFAIHGIAAIWRVALVYKKNKYWFQAITLFGIPIEFFVTLYVNNGHEWKWFCPSVFFYLCTVIPSVWFLELNIAEIRSRGNGTQTIHNPSNSLNSDTDYGLPLIKFKIPPEMWTLIIEQTLLLVLIIGRWLLPVGKTMTRDHLSQLLLVYIGTAADIIEIFEAFKEPDVQRNLTIVRLILVAWSISLMQFTLVVTATKKKKIHTNASKKSDSKDKEKCLACRLFWETELWAISTTILLQDGPFLCLRLGLIIHYKIISQSNVFFTTKNFLVVVLQLYRVCVIISGHRKRHRLAQSANNNLIIRPARSLPLLSKRNNNRRKLRADTMISTSNGSVNFDLNPTKKHQTHSLIGINELGNVNGVSDPLPRRKRLLGSNQTMPILATSRRGMSHSRSLTTVNQPKLNLSSRKMYTAV